MRLPRINTISKEFILRFGLVVLFIGATFKVLFAQEATLGLLLNKPGVSSGYTMFSGNKNTYLINNCGDLINVWESGLWSATTFYLLENGDLLRPVKLFEETGFNGGGVGGGIERMNWQGEQIWLFDFAEEQQYHQHHDIEIMPNGNILILAWEYKSVEAAIEAGRNPSNIEEALWPTLVVEIEPKEMNGADIVWEWHLWDHLVQDFDAGRNNYGNVRENHQLLDVNFIDGNLARADWLHCNALFYVPQFDWIVLSSKYLNEIYVIDHSTTTIEAASHSGGKYGKGGDLLYRWGNPQAYRQGAKQDKKLYDQHDVTFIPSTENEPAQFLVFNNGTKRPEGRYSTVISFELPIDKNGFFKKEAGEAFAPEEYHWEYIEQPDTFELYSPNGSSAQRLPNGNTLIAEGNTGYFFELNDKAEKVWVYQNPVSATGPLEQGTIVDGVGLTGTLGSHRIRKYPMDYPAFKDRDVSPKGKIELNPLNSDCVISSTVQNYEFQKELLIYPNPVDCCLHINSENMFFYEIMNVNTQIVMQGNFQKQINVENLRSGVYFLKLNYNNQITIKKIVKQ